jgi:hypothetical protein
MVRRRMVRCECGKKVYESQDHAISAALRNSGVFGKAVRAYDDCPLGGGWHLTTRPEGRRPDGPDRRGDAGGAGQGPAVAEPQAQPVHQRESPSAQVKRRKT